MYFVFRNSAAVSRDFHHQDPPGRHDSYLYKRCFAFTTRALLGSKEDFGCIESEKLDSIELKLRGRVARKSFRLCERHDGKRRRTEPGAGGTRCPMGRCASPPALSSPSARTARARAELTRLHRLQEGKSVLTSRRHQGHHCRLEDRVASARMPLQSLARLPKLWSSSWELSQPTRTGTAALRPHSGDNSPTAYADQGYTPDRQGKAC